jgi:cellulose synthase/poly-beta-1,6-N-acetylglucosamine synthase-like glycosyltransferase
VSAPGDSRLGPIHWPIPDQRRARRRAVVMALICAGLAAWYLSWLLAGGRVGSPVLFGLLIGAEAFNLIQALGFWWTCSRQRMRRGLAPTLEAATDVMIPVYDEPVDVVEPTVAAAARLHGADVRVWLLDDGRREEMRRLAGRHGVDYLTRPDNEGAKAGNLNHALGVTSAPYVAVLDCDHVPRPEFLERTLGHLEDFGVAFVQTPQYYANGDSGPIAAAAAAQQNLFFGPIARGKDGLDAMFCCGTNVVFRRRALEEVGGFPQDSVTEDFELSVRLHEAGWRSVYVPEVLACGLGPEDMASYVSQQQRWARGCLGSIPSVLRARLPWRLRLQYLLSATYFLSGLTLLVYMSLPVTRILLGAQPLAAATADQFLLHFAPYYCGALATVAMAGYGTYTFEAFALASGSFWIHVQAAINTLLRRPARFVVTPKHGTVSRQPRAVAPALAAIAVLIGAAIYGLSQSHGAATLNNVAFASLHASILLTAVIPALRLRPSAPLLPDPPPRPLAPAARPVPAAAGRSGWPRPLAASALLAAVLVPVALGVLGSRGLANHPSLSEKAHASAEAFFSRYVQPDGRVVRSDQGGDTVSEGQAYAMLLAVALDDRAGFNRVWGWTRENLQRDDGLLSFHWSGGRVDSDEPATDADLDAARALVLAGKRFGSSEYTEEGVRIGQAILDQETADVDGVPVLVAGPWARSTPPDVNPSYFSPRAYADLASARADEQWDSLAGTSRAITSALVRGGAALPPDWSQVDSLAPGADGEATASAAPVSSPAGAASASSSGAPASGLDAVRVAIRSAESCVPEDRRLAASLWPLYRRDPGLATYSLDGSPAGRATHAASFVAAAASARAAGEDGEAEQLLDEAQETDSAHPTYYGAAWVALGRVMLTSSALGACPD